MSQSHAFETPPRAWLIVALLWLAAGFDYLDRVIATTMHQSLVAAFQMTDAQYGLLTSVFLWSYGLLSPIGGYIADRCGRSRVIIASVAAWSAVTWLTAYTTTFHGLLVTRALLGFTQACYVPAALALIVDYNRGPTRSLAVGVHMAGFSIGSASGGLGGWLADRHGWSYAFSLFGLAGLAYSGVLLALLRDAPQGSAVPSPAAEVNPPVRFGAALASLFTRGSFLLLVVFWGLMAVVGWALVGWMPVFVQEHFHLGQGAAGITTTGYLHISSLLGVLIGGLWADRWSRTNARSRIWVPVIGLCVAAPAILLTAGTSFLAAAIFGLVLYGLARSAVDANLMPILCLVADSRYRATGYGVLNACASLVGGLTIYAGGALRDAKVDLSLVFQFAAVSMLLAAGILFLVKPSDTVTAQD